jgi:polysaccharide deacetylase family protein (PEP-CTERM system associated)
VEYILEQLDRYNVTGTFFILGWIAERNGPLVRAIADAGHEVACHGYSHKRITEITPVDFRGDIRKAKQILENIIGREVLGYRAPSFSIMEKTSWALDIIGEAGFFYDSSIYPVYRGDYGIPHAPRSIYKIRETGMFELCEVPLASLEFPLLGRMPLGGGGYFRWYPYAITDWGLKRINRIDGFPWVFYLHPWEIDIEHPRVEGLPWLTRLRHYGGIGGNRKRLEKLLQSFEFTSIIDLIGPIFEGAASPEKTVLDVH